MDSTVATELKIVSLNMQHGRHIRPLDSFAQPAQLDSLPLSPPYILKNLRKIGKFLADQETDIILLQEVDRVSPITPRIDHLAHIASAVGFDYAAHGASGKISLGGMTLYSAGCGILSRFPILDSWSVQFDLCFPSRKGFVAATIALPSGDVTVVSAHLSPLDMINGNSKKIQIEKMSAALSGRRPLVLGGDMNSDTNGRGRESILTLAARLDLQTDASALEGRLASFPSYWPTRKFDWIFASSELEISEYQILSERVSDHLAISAMVTL
ncbi:MAG: endonuclease/exonuclease/phosphatase family protein [Parcubacteria group bacterium]|nr:endonuclease/exonuclease/phosphatase family protein [Parcubacteria group bacterium]